MCYQPHQPRAAGRTRAPKGQGGRARRGGTSYRRRRGGEPAPKRGGHSPRRAGAAKAAAPERLNWNNGLGGTSYPKKRARPHPARTTAAWRSTLPATAPPAGKAERAPHPPPPPPHQRRGQGLPGGAGRGSTTDRPGRKAAPGRRRRSREVPAPRPLPPPRGTGAGYLNRAPAGAHRFRLPAGIGSPWGAYGGTYRRRQRRPPGV